MARGHLRSDSREGGNRRYWEDWAASVADIAARHTTRIKALLDDPDLDVSDDFDRFLEGLRCNLNDTITRDDAIDMLSQHLITRPVFDALFADYSFAENNPVSQVMEGMLARLDEQNLDAENETLERFYDSVRVRVEGIDNAEGKQKIITELYERFFKLAFPKVSRQLGIVYTPTEIIDFIHRSVEQVLQREFGASVSDPGVHVLDPFTGTGTFFTRLLQSGLVRPEDLARKYASELHANEMLLLAYYIAAVNIEATYHSIAKAEYVPFEGIVLTDTFQMTEGDGTLDDVIFPSNNRRAAHQRQLDIRVIIGNPPYSSNREGDDTPNIDYPTLDSKIEGAYVARSNATNKNALYDSYIRAFRWASNRILESADSGVVAFVTNGAYLDTNIADGFRKALVDEFHAIYSFNLRGNARTSGERRQKEKGNVFGAGSRNTVAITLLVKKPGESPGAELYYRDIGDYLSEKEKLSIVAGSSLDTMPWERLEPNEHGDWLNQRSDDGYDAFMPIGSRASGDEAVFRVFSTGVNSGRDAWMYSFSRQGLSTQVKRLIDFYNAQVDTFLTRSATNPGSIDKDSIDEFIEQDPTRINWNDTDKKRLLRGIRYEHSESRIVPTLYRPFTREWLYYDPNLIERLYQLPHILPASPGETYGIFVIAPTQRTPFSVLAVRGVPDSKLFVDAGHYYPRYTYPQHKDGMLTADDEGRVDNVTDRTLHAFARAYGDTVTKDDIFHYVYGLLHAPEYRDLYSANLGRVQPRIPFVADEGFWEYVRAGEELFGLHLGYEDIDPYPLEERRTGNESSEESLYRLDKMRFRKADGEQDRSTIVYNAHLSLAGIPDAAYEYQLGSRSALEWVMDRYQVSKDARGKSGIVNDPNDWRAESDSPRYVVELLARVAAVSVKTVEIVNALPKFRIAEGNSSKSTTGA